MKALTNAVVERIAVKIRKLMTLGQTSAIVPITIYPHYVTRGTEAYRVGTYISLPRKMKIRFKPPQVSLFAGVHECLCILLVRPQSVSDLLTLTESLPSAEPFGPITWVGNVTPSNNRRDALLTTRLYLPSLLWFPIKEMVPKATATTAIIQLVRDRYNRKYTLLHIPAITRYGLLPSYTSDAETKS